MKDVFKNNLSDILFYQYKDYSPVSSLRSDCFFRLTFEVIQYQQIKCNMESNSNSRTVHEFITSRYSPLAFSDKAVEPEKIMALFEAARWAPSSFNEQPWRFVYALRENRPEFDAMLDCLAEGNRIWARNAPMIVLSVARMSFSRNSKPNKHAFHDVGLAVGNLLTQATHIGLMVHQMGGFSVEKARQNLLIPPGYEPVAMIAIGYHGNVDDLPEDLKVRELQTRTRKPLQEIVYPGTMS
jgi:nitroreductase